MGGLFGRRGGSDFSGVIRALRESDRASQNRFLAIMEQNRKSHEEYMKKLNEELKIIQEENDRIKTEYRDEIKKKEEEYEKKQKEKTIFLQNAFSIVLVSQKNVVCLN